MEKDGEVDDGDGGGHEQRLQLDDFGVNEEDERKGDGAAQPTVRHHELFDPVQLVQPEFVGERRQNHHTCRKKSMFKRT